MLANTGRAIQLSESLHAAARECQQHLLEHDTKAAYADYSKATRMAKRIVEALNKPLAKFSDAECAIED